jgi:hypothetical protein
VRVTQHTQQRKPELDYRFSRIFRRLKYRCKPAPQLASRPPVHVRPCRGITYEWHIYPYTRVCALHSKGVSSRHIYMTPANCPATSSVYQDASDHDGVPINLALGLDELSLGPHITLHAGPPYQEPPVILNNMRFPAYALGRAVFGHLEPANLLRAEAACSSWSAPWRSMLL